MQNKKLSHEELQKNIPELKGKSEGSYLYHEGYVYYSFSKPGGGADQTGWLNGGVLYKRVKDDGTEITSFEKTCEESVTTASSSHVYSHTTPQLKDGYVYFEIKYTYDCDWADEEVTWLTFRVKADGISELEILGKRK